MGVDEWLVIVEGEGKRPYFTRRLIDERLVLVVYGRISPLFCKVVVVRNGRCQKKFPVAHYEIMRIISA